MLSFDIKYISVLISVMYYFVPDTIYYSILLWTLCCIHYVIVFLVVCLSTLNNVRCSWCKISWRVSRHLRITVRFAEAVGGVSRPLVGIQVYLPESSGMSLEMSRVPSTMILTRDFRELQENTEGFFNMHQTKRLLWGGGDTSRSNSTEPF